MSYKLRTLAFANIQRRQTKTRFGLSGKRYIADSHEQGHYGELAWRGSLNVNNIFPIRRRSLFRAYRQLCCREPQPESNDCAWHRCGRFAPNLPSAVLPGQEQVGILLYCFLCKSHAPPARRMKAYFCFFEIVAATYVNISVLRSHNIPRVGCNAIRRTDREADCSAFHRQYTHLRG